MALSLNLTKRPLSPCLMAYSSWFLVSCYRLFCVMVSSMLDATPFIISRLWRILSNVVYGQNFKFELSRRNTHCCAVSSLKRLYFSSDAFSSSLAASSRYARRSLSLNFLRLRLGKWLWGSWTRTPTDLPPFIFLFVFSFNPFSSDASNFTALVLSFLLACPSAFTPSFDLRGVSLGPGLVALLLPAGVRHKPSKFGESYFPTLGSERSSSSEGDLAWGCGYGDWEVASVIWLMPWTSVRAKFDNPTLGGSRVFGLGTSCKVRSRPARLEYMLVPARGHWAGEHLLSSSTADARLSPPAAACLLPSRSLFRSSFVAATSSLISSLLNWASSSSSDSRLTTYDLLRFVKRLKLAMNWAQWWNIAALPESFEPIKSLFW